MDDDGEAEAIAHGAMASCAFEFWAYVVAHSRRLDDGRAQSLQLDDELAGRQKVAKALREQGYRIAIRMVQQTRNRDYEFWSRDEPQTRNRETMLKQRTLTGGSNQRVAVQANAGRSLSPLSLVDGLSCDLV